MYQPIPPRIKRGLSAVDAPNGLRVAYCDTYEQARVIAWALNVLAYQHGWLSSDELRVVDDHCPICHEPINRHGDLHDCINWGIGTSKDALTPAEWGFTP